MDSHQELVELLVDGARYGDLEDVEAALAQHVGVDSKDAAGRTALLMACANGHEEIVRRLLQAGADVDLKNNEGNTALHWACLNNHKGAVQLLMAKNASASALNAAGRTPVDEALSRDAQEILDVINSFHGGAVQVEEVDDVEGAAEGGQEDVEGQDVEGGTAGVEAGEGDMDEAMGAEEALMPNTAGSAGAEDAPAAAAGTPSAPPSA